MNHPRRTSGACRVLCLLAACVGASLGGSNSLIAQGGTTVGDPIAETRNALSEWVKTERIAAAERTKWREGKSLLEARIELVKQRIEALRDEIAEDKGVVKTSSGKKDELVQRRDSLRASTTTLASSIRAHEQRVQTLLPQLPAPLQDTVRPLVARIPKDPTGAGDLSQRYFNVLGIMNAVNAFNQSVSIHSEIRKLEGGKEVRVGVLYMGLGQAYFATALGDRAGVGRPGHDGWVWTAVDDHASRIAQLIAIYKNQAPAAFVPVPVKVQ